jgi:hypothetical protein
MLSRLSRTSAPVLIVFGGWFAFALLSAQTIGAHPAQAGLAAGKQHAPRGWETFCRQNPDECDADVLPPRG